MPPSQRPQAATNATAVSARAVAAMGWVFALVPLVVLPGALSPFRGAKMAVALVGIALVVGGWLIRHPDRLGMMRPASPFQWALAGLPALYLVSASWSVDPLGSIGAAAAAGVWLVAILWLGLLAPEQRARLAVWAATGAGLSAVVMLGQLAGWRPLGAEHQGFSSRFQLTGLAGNPADLAMASVLLLPLVMEAAELRGRWRWAWGVAALLVAATVLSQTLTGMFALVGVGLVWLVVRRSLRSWTVVLGAGALVTASALAIGVGPRLDTLSRDLRSGNYYMVLSARADGWSAASEMIQSHPFTGVGAAAFSDQFYPHRLMWLERHNTSGGRGESASHFEHAHCDPLHLVAETGLPGSLWLIAATIALWRSRQRRDWVVLQMSVALAPFALLHYPHHLAVALIPLVLAAARFRSPEGTLSSASGGMGRRRRLVRAVALLLLLATVGWQVRAIAVDTWRGLMHIAVRSLSFPGGGKQSALAEALETELLRRRSQLIEHQPWVDRKLGSVRIERGEYRAAERALRRSMATAPHEETELRLALALAGQGRRTEALQALERVTRVNPRLVPAVREPSLRRALDELIAAQERDGLR